jgi:site-specific DNA-methyltransferase (adenine-specific)
MKKEINLMLGDNMELFKQLEDNSVDSIVTDGPYGLSFMNKKWDYEVPSIDFWKEALRVLKPGGHVLSFGGTRTYHRMVVNMEDAGFEIRDQIMWIYGSGFPKSLNIGKAFDKKNSNEREVTGEQTTPNISNANFMDSKGRDRVIVNITKGSSQYEGWGTALKPANEPICLARKPLSEKTIIDNVIKWGTGGINVDGCRIDTNENLIRDNKTNPYGGDMWIGGDNVKPSITGSEEGRFPANILFDEEAAAELDKQTGITKSSKLNKPLLDIKGGASRFFYVTKVSKKERNLGLDDSNIEKNNHPTLKPINLMSYLIKLITPEGGVVLDPFMGSGSCGIAAALGDYKYIGMELDEDYFQIAEQRIKEYEQYRNLIKNGTR